MEDKKTKTLRISVYVIYIISLIFNIWIGVVTKELLYLSICIWIINALVIFWIKAKVDDINDDIINWQYKIIDNQNKTIDEQYELIKNMLDSAGGVYNEKEKE